MNLFHFAVPDAKTVSRQTVVWLTTLSLIIWSLGLPLGILFSPPKTYAAPLNVTGSPYVIDVYFGTPNAVVVKFNESMNPSTIGTDDFTLTTNYGETPPNNPAPTAVSMLALGGNDDTGVLVTAANSVISPSFGDQVTVKTGSGAPADTSANLQTDTFGFNVHMPPLPFQVLISEVHVDGSSPSVEAIELYNKTASAVDLNGWSLKSISSTGVETLIKTFGSGTSIAGSSFFSVGHANFGSANVDQTYGTLGDGGLLDDNESVILYDNATPAVARDLVGWGTAPIREGDPAPGPSANGSIERKATPSSTTADMEGAHATWGNAYDSNNNSFDFVVHSPSLFAILKASSPAELEFGGGGGGGGYTSGVPGIDHWPVFEAANGNPLQITARMWDPETTNDMLTAQLKYIPANAADWSGVTIVTGNHIGAGFYKFPIPGTAVTSNDVKYYLKVTDSDSNSICLSANTGPPSTCAPESGHQSNAFLINGVDGSGWTGTVAGTVRDGSQAGTPGIANANVIVRGKGFNTTTAANGTFTLSGLPPAGAISLVVVSAGFMEGWLDTNTGASGIFIDLWPGSGGGQGGDMTMGGVMWTAPNDGNMGAPQNISAIGSEAPAPILIAFTEPMDSTTLDGSTTAVTSGISTPKTVTDPDAAGVNVKLYKFDSATNAKVTSLGVSPKIASYKIVYDRGCAPSDTPGTNCGVPGLAMNFGPDPKVIIYDPDSDPVTLLESNTPYLVELTPAVQTSNGNALQGNRPGGGHSLFFMTTAGFSTTGSITTGNFGTGGFFMPPFIETTSPSMGAFGVPPNTKVLLSFSESMDSASITSTNIKLYRVTNPFTASETLTEVSATLSLDTATKKLVTLTPSTALTQGNYRVKVLGAVKSESGISIGPPGSETQEFFRLDFDSSGTADTTGPSVNGTSLQMFYDPGTSTITNVPTSHAIEIGMSESLDPSTANTQTVTLAAGTSSVTTKVEYDSWGHGIWVTPTTATQANTTYTLSLTTGVKDLSGNALASAYTQQFTTGAADTTVPRVEYVGGDDFSLAITFTEPMNAANISDANKYSSSVLNPANYKLYYYTISGGQTIHTGNNCSAGCDTLAEAQGLSFTFEAFHKTLLIEGFSGLGSNVEFRIYASNVTDVSGNVIANSGNSTDPSLGNGAGGTTKSSADTFGQIGPGGGGMMDPSKMTGPTGFGTYNVGDMAFQPVGVFPMNSTAGRLTPYFVDFPTTNAVQNGDIITLTFPSGFDVTSATKDAFSPVNNDFNEFNGGTITFDGTYGGGDGVLPDAIARTVKIKLSVTGTPPGADFLHFDLDKIKNSTIPKDYNTSGYTVDMKLDRAGTILESKTSMPFFITEAGVYKITGTLTAPVNIASGQEVRLTIMSPFGPVPPDSAVTFSGSTTATYTFSNLNTGWYNVMFEPTITLTKAAGGTIDLLSPMSNGIQLPDVGNAGYNDSTKTYTSNVTLADATAGRIAFTVNITGAFGTDDVDIFANSYNGWVVKTLADAGNNPSANVYLGNGTWWVGIGPAMPKTFGAMSGPPPMPSWMPPQPQEVIVTGCPSSCSASPSSLAFTITAFEEQVIGYVQDGAGNGLADVQVFGYQTTGNFGMPSNTTTDTTGKFILKTTTGLFALGAWKQGLPPPSEVSVEVKNENAVTGGNADGNTLSDVLRNGTLVTATNKLILKIEKSDYTITGTVYDSTDSTAAVVPYAPVWAQNSVTGEMAPGGTDERGKYTLFVKGSATGVTWKVQGHIPGLGDIAPVSVVVQDTSSICASKQCTQNLRPSVSQANMAVISGRVYASTDATYTAGEELTDAQVWIEGQDSSGNFYGNGSSADSQGKYSMKIPAGTNYKIHAWTSLYGEQPEIILGTVTAATTYANKDFRVDSGNIRTITPAFTNAPSGLEGFVDAFKPSTGSGFHIRVANIGSVAAGERLKLADGTYEVRAYIPGFGDIAATGNPITIAGDATVTFVLPAAGSRVTLSGTVCLGPDVGGDGLCDDGETAISSGAFVWLDKLSGVGGTFGGNHYGTKADGSGAYTVILEEGTYMLGVDVPGYSSPAPVEVTYLNATSATPTKDFVVTLNADTISGSVYIDATTKATKGWVWAERVTSATDLATHASGGWAGGPIENGNYTLSVGDGFWRVFAVAEGFQKGFTNSGTCVGATNSCSPTSPTGVNLTLTALTNYTPPVPKITKITPATGGVVDDTENSGVKVIIEPNSISNTTISSSTELQVIVRESTATIENKSQKSVMGKNIEISVVDPSSGTAIKNFNPAITVEYHYNDSDLPVGTSESELSWQEIDPVTGQYVAVSSVVDTTNNIIRSTTNTLSAFASGGSAGASPPATPSTPTVTQSGSTVTLTWAASTESTVVGYEVYRSTSSTGTFPNISGDSTAGGSFDQTVLVQRTCVGVGQTCTYNTTLSQNGTYYYKIRAFVNGSTYSDSSAAGSVNYVTPQGGSPSGGGSTTTTTPTPTPTPEEEVTSTPEEEVTPTPTPTATTPTYTDGTLIQATGSPDVYVVRDGKKLHVPSWDAFVAAGYSLSDVKEVPASDVAATNSAALFRVDGDDKVYVIKGRNTLHVPTPEALVAWGYSWSDVSVVPAKDASGYKKITLARVEGDDKVYVLGSGVKRHIPNPDVFNTSGYDWASIELVSGTELAEYAQSGLIRGAGQAKVYLVEDKSKRWVTTGEVFAAKGYNWAHIQEVSATELTAYTAGADITE